MLYSLYEKALSKRNFNFDIESNTEIKSQLVGKWFDRNIIKSPDNFSIAAGDGSFNKRKFLKSNFCAVGAESVIYDNDLKKIDDCEIFDVPHVSFLDELLSNYMSIFELKCALRTIKKHDVDFYLFDGSILGDLDNAFPRGAKLPSIIRDNLNKELLNDFEKRLSVTQEGFVFPHVLKSKVLKDGEINDLNKLQEFNLQMASIEKIILLKELLNYRKKIISISKTSSDNSIFKWNVPDIAFLDRFTQKQGLTKIQDDLHVFNRAAFPFFNDFFKRLTFTVFYVRLEDYKNVLKVELPYRASKEEVFRIIEKLKVFSVKGYPYLLNMAHNDVVIKNKDMKELLKIARVYETTNREML